MSTLNGRQLTSVTAHVTNFALTSKDNATAHTNTGAAGVITASLPAATPGLRFKFAVGAAQAFHIDPNGNETISLPSTGVAGAAGKYLTSATVGATVEIECFVAGTWAVTGFTAAWTAEP